MQSAAATVATGESVYTQTSNQYVCV